MKTTFYQVRGKVKGLDKVKADKARMEYVLQMVDDWNNGNPYSFGYMVANSVVNLVLSKHWTENLYTIKNNLHTAYKSLVNGLTDADADAIDLISESVAVLFENNCDYRSAQRSIRAYIAQQSVKWDDTPISYYADFETGEIHRLPKALTCAIDGTGKSCTVSSYTVADIDDALNEIPLSRRERQFLGAFLSGLSFVEIATRYGVAIGTVSSTIANARAKARCSLAK